MFSLLIGDSHHSPSYNFSPQSVPIGQASHTPTGQTRHILNATQEGARSLEAVHILAVQLLSGVVSSSQLLKLNSKQKQCGKLLTSVACWSVKRRGTFPPLIYPCGHFLVCHGSLDVCLCRWHSGGLLRHPVDRRLCVRPLCQVLQSRSLLSHRTFSQCAARLFTAFCLPPLRLSCDSAEVTVHDGSVSFTPGGTVNWKWKRQT